MPEVRVSAIDVISVVENEDSDDFTSSIAFTPIVENEDANDRITSIVFLALVVPAGGLLNFRS